jgi:hypothetical protein
MNDFNFFLLSYAECQEMKWQERPMKCELIDLSKLPRLTPTDIGS